MTKRNQGGSLVVFLVVGVLFAAALIGGIYTLRHQEAQKPTQKPQPVTTPAETKEQPAPKPETVPEAPKQPEVPKKDNTNNETVKPATPAPSKSTELPRTGPAETIATLIAIGALSTVSVAYVRSRRPSLSF